MKVVFTTLLFCFCFVLILKAEDWNKVRQTIEENNNKIEKGLVKGDVDLVMSYYTEDAISLPEYEPALKGNPAIKKKTEKDFLGITVTSIDFKTTDLFGSGDLAVEIGEWNLVSTNAGSTNQEAYSGKYVFIWEKQNDNSWKIKTETWNANAYPTLMSEGTESKTDEVK